MCSAALETVGTAWTESAPIRHASEEVGCRPSEPSDALIGCVPAVLIGGVLANRLAPPAVEEAYCINRRMYPVLCS